jgi:hypothetical protein
MTRPRYLTKSRYKTGLECPTKLYYTSKKAYPDSKMDDPFMAALAQGGYQVGELAKYYFPGGHDVTSLDYEEAEAQTNALLEQENVIIYEPAIRFGDLFVRIDVLVKEGNHFELIEVKAKSIDTKDESPFFGKRGGLNSDWKAYLYDVAFQHHVLKGVFPHSTINCSLMLADKHVVCGTNSLNQKFKITRDNNRMGVTVSSSLSEEDLKHKILVQVPVDDAVVYINEQFHDDGKSFVENIDYLADRYKSDIKIPPCVGAHCKKCEYTCSTEDEESGLKSGFKECWQQANKWTEEDFQESNVLELWNFRGTQKLIDADKIKFTDLSEEDFKLKDDGKSGLSTSQRQWLQVEMTRDGDTQAYLDVTGLKAEMDTWVYPLHFIDFETTTVALPFTQGRKPYEGIAFQFSHHMVHEDGRVEHVGQYLNTARETFPNYDFVRELKAQLEQDEGTTFRYADHENSYLNLILKQIIADQNLIEDAKELIDFIKSITHSTGKVKPPWKGTRDMVDLLYLVKRYYYHPSMKGSNSLKQVLPAVLESSDFLKEKYSQPIYGAEGGIPSLNFSEHTWLKMKDGHVVDPYKQLPKLFNDVSDKNVELLSEEDELANGGAAMTAYAKIQFEDMSDYEREELEQGLLKYCELDTLAMVMIYEAWNAEMDG